MAPNVQGKPSLQIGVNIALKLIAGVLAFQALVGIWETAAFCYSGMTSRDDCKASFEKLGTIATGITGTVLGYLAPSRLGRAERAPGPIAPRMPAAPTSTPPAIHGTRRREGPEA